MGLLSIFKRKTETRTGAVPAGVSTASVQQARARARQRLIGALVLVVVGIIAFPLLFESQPRPIPVDIPIEIPRKDGAPTLVMPSARPASAVAESIEVPLKPGPEETKRDAVVQPPVAASAATSVAATEKSEPPVATKPVLPPSASPERAAPSKAAEPAPGSSVPAPATMPKPNPTAESARAKALLEGKPQASKPATGFVVQFGAFADAAAAQQTRARVDALGLKSYTQATETSAGKRVRVRVGPFASREEAERVLIRAKAAGLSAVVLTP